MGERSSFGDEDEIHFHDELLKDFANAMVKKGGDLAEHWESIAEWMNNNEHFSFEVFNEWKLQGYWYLIHVG
jgi:hypothetical protein